MLRREAWYRESLERDLLRSRQRKQQNPEEHLKEVLRRGLPLEREFTPEQLQDLSMKGLLVTPQEVERFVEGFIDSALDYLPEDSEFYDDGDAEEVSDYDRSYFGDQDVTPEDRAKIETVAEAFLRKAYPILHQLEILPLDSSLEYSPNRYNLYSVGSDFYLEQYGHGVGYQDRDLGEAGKALSKIVDEDFYLGQGLRPYKVGDEWKLTYE